MPLAGWLADTVFEPVMISNDGLSAFRWIVGSGPGSGMSLILILAGLGGILVMICGYAFRTIRHVEDILPDYDGNPPMPVESAVATR